MEQEVGDIQKSAVRWGFFLDEIVLFYPQMILTGREFASTSIKSKISVKSHFNAFDLFQETCICYLAVSHLFSVLVSRQSFSSAFNMASLSLINNFLHLEKTTRERQ